MVAQPLYSSPLQYGKFLPPLPILSPNFLKEKYLELLALRGIPNEKRLHSVGLGRQGSRLKIHGDLSNESILGAHLSWPSQTVRGSPSFCYRLGVGTKDLEPVTGALARFEHYAAS